MRIWSLFMVLCIFTLAGCEITLSPAIFEEGWFAGIQIVDDKTFSAVNNADGFADAGEELRLNIDLQNITLIYTTNVFATLRSLHSCAIVDPFEDTVYYWDLYEGETSTGGESFSVYLSQECANVPYVDFELTIESDDFFPWVEVFSIPVHGISGAMLEVDQVELDDSTIFSSVNNGDGFANAGEEVRLEVSVRNTGIAEARGVIGTLVSEAPCATVSGSDDTVNFNDIKPGPPKFGTGYFKVHLTFSCAMELEVPLTLYLEDNNLGSWVQTIIIPIVPTEAALEINAVTVIEEGWMSLENNGDGFANPGEEIELEVSIFNAGYSAAQEVIGTLVTSTACAGVIGSHDTIAFNDVNVDQVKTATNRFRVTISHACAGLPFADFTLFLEDNMGNVWEQIFSVPLY